MNIKQYETLIKTGFLGHLGLDVGAHLHRSYLISILHTIHTECLFDASASFSSKISRGENSISISESIPGRLTVNDQRETVQGNEQGGGGGCSGKSFSRIVSQVF